MHRPVADQGGRLLRPWLWHRTAYVLDASHLEIPAGAFSRPDSRLGVSTAVSGELA